MTSPRRNHKRVMTEPCVRCQKVGGLHFGHGLCGGCYKRQRTAKARQFKVSRDVELNYADTLAGGSWRLRGATKVWVPVEVLIVQQKRPLNKRMGERLPFTMTPEQQRRGWSQYVQGVRTPFAIDAAREYRRASKQRTRAQKGQAA